MRLARTLAAGLLLVAGCTGSGYVPVSGVVTLDGHPYKNAVVSFQPLGTEDNPNPGHGSSALTDEQGRFTLVTDDGHFGAVAGKHRVRIQTNRETITPAPVDPNVGSSDDPHAAQGGKLDPMLAKGKADPIPVEWYSDTGGKEFVVPPGGTDKANFEIVSTKKK